MPFGIGIWEALILVGIILLVVGPKKAPAIARSLGRGVREVKDTVDGTQRELRDAVIGSNPTATERERAAQPARKELGP